MDDWMQFHTIKAHQALLVFLELYKAMKKPSGKEDLAIYSVLLWCLDSAQV